MLLKSLFYEKTVKVQKQERLRTVILTDLMNKLQPSGGTSRYEQENGYN